MRLNMRPSFGAASIQSIRERAIPTRTKVPHSLEDTIETRIKDLLRANTALSLDLEKLRDKWIKDPLSVPNSLLSLRDQVKQAKPAMLRQFSEPLPSIESIADTLNRDSSVSSSGATEQD